MTSKTIKYHVLGIMSGSSLDGVDLAFCKFYYSNKKWKFEITQSETIAYKPKWIEILTNIHLKSAEELIELHSSYGIYIGKLANIFIKKHQLQPDLIASHGHTVFHNPAAGFTFQLGEGQALSTSSGYPCTCDFRTKDILLGGQGAPLVPVGDQLLFSKFDICLNLGGIANLSYQENGKRLAWDICPANQILNQLAKNINLPFDEGGESARTGRLIPALYDQLNNDPFYRQNYPKSLANEYVRSNFISIVDKAENPVQDKLRTVVEHIVYQIDESTNQLSSGKILVTGGGAKNTFLIDRLTIISKHLIIIPDEKIIDFKEALIFAFLGVLNKRGEPNCLSSVTGASTDCCSGVNFYP